MIHSSWIVKFWKLPIVKLAFLLRPLRLLRLFSLAYQGTEFLFSLTQDQNFTFPRQLHVCFFLSCHIPTRFLKIAFLKWYPTVVLCCYHPHKVKNLAFDVMFHFVQEFWRQQNLLYWIWCLSKYTRIWLHNVSVYSLTSRVILKQLASWAIDP